MYICDNIAINTHYIICLHNIPLNTIEKAMRNHPMNERK